MSSAVRTEFFDSRDKYLSFVSATDEKTRIAFFLADELARMKAPPAGDPFYLLDAGTGEGTVVATFLTALHKRMPQKPIVATGKEISVDDICILLGYLPDRFAEHKQLVFHITNLTYAELASGEHAHATHVARALRGNTSHDFGLQLMNMSDVIKDGWALQVQDGRLRPKKKMILTLYRHDQREFLQPLLRLPARHHFVIASQAFRLRRAPAQVASNVVAPLLSMLANGGRMALIYASGNDFSRALLRRLYPQARPYIYAAPQKLLAALQKLPAYAGIRARIGTLRYGFINLYLGRSEFSLGNIVTLWKAVTYVAQLSDAETAAAPLGRGVEQTMQTHLARAKDVSFVNNVIVFKKSAQKK